MAAMRKIVVRGASGAIQEHGLLFCAQSRLKNFHRQRGHNFLWDTMEADGLWVVLGITPLFLRNLTVGPEQAAESNTAPPPWENEGGPVLLCACILSHRGGVLTQIGREKVCSQTLPFVYEHSQVPWDLGRERGLSQEEEYVGGRNSTVFLVSWATLFTTLNPGFRISAWPRIVLVIYMG